MSNKELILQVTKTFCSAYKLYYLTHSCHWDIEGAEFYEMHKLLEKQYKSIWKSLDAIAEKIRQLDAYPPSSLTFIYNTGEQYEDCSKLSAQDMARSLVTSHEKMIVSLNNAIQACKKVGREDLTSYFGELWEEHSEMRWMLRATAKRYGTITPVESEPEPDDLTF